MSFTVNLFDWREFRFKVFSNLTAKWILLVFILTQQQHQFVDGKVTQFSKGNEIFISLPNANYYVINKLFCREKKDYFNQKKKLITIL